MDREKFNEAFNSEDKQLWRRINKSGVVCRKERSSKNKAETNFAFSTENNSKAEEMRPPISNILEIIENIFCDLPSISHFCEDNQNDFCESTQREEDL